MSEPAFNFVPTANRSKAHNKGVDAQSHEHLIHGTIPRTLAKNYLLGKQISLTTPVLTGLHQALPGLAGQVIAAGRAGASLGKHIQGAEMMSLEELVYHPSFDWGTSGSKPMGCSRNPRTPLIAKFNQFRGVSAELMPANPSRRPVESKTTRTPVTATTSASGDYHGVGGWLHQEVYEPLQRDYDRWIAWGQTLGRTWNQSVPVAGQIAGDLVGFVPVVAGAANKMIVGIPQFLTPKTEEEHVLFAATAGMAPAVEGFHQGAVYGYWWLRNLLARRPELEAQIGESALSQIFREAERRAPSLVHKIELSSTVPESIQKSILQIADPKSIVRYNPINPGPLEMDAMNTFRGGSYTFYKLRESTILYRVWGGDANPLARFWTRTVPTGPLQAKLDLALLDEWGNTAAKIIRIKVPAGTQLCEGIVESQPGLVGGGSQVFIPKVDPAWVVQP